MQKVPYGGNARRFEYHLTAKGKALYPVIMSLADWGNQWLIDKGEEPIVHVHQDCEQHTRPVMSCSAYGDELKPQRVTVIPGNPLQTLRQSLSEKELTTEIGYRAPAL